MTAQKHPERVDGLTRRPAHTPGGPQNLPADLLKHPSASFWLDLQTAVAPALILIVELLVPALMWIEVRTGCAFGAFFHWMIAITPPPNGTPPPGGRRWGAAAAFACRAR